MVLAGLFASPLRHDYQLCPLKVNHKVPFGKVVRLKQAWLLDHLPKRSLKFVIQKLTGGSNCSMPTPQLPVPPLNDFLVLGDLLKLLLQVRLGVYWTLS
jgi:hypothetical protein